MKKLHFLTAAIILSLGISTLPSKPADALTGSQFNPGRIIDDSVFFNGGGMSAGGIQAFLNSKVPTCDTYHARSGSSNDSGPPYTCLKDYVQDTTPLGAEAGLCNGFSGGRKSAAQIIHEVGVSCGINPTVILITLQKEQSLVTDVWPWAIQYQKATGYACPDTAPCDPNYAGFFKQVYYGARQFKRYARDANLFRYRAGRDNYIQYHPNTACGGTNVYIQNQATAGLYNYTPYQPNAAALANLEGTGDSCSAYGNRNFWRMYNYWFGSTLGSLIRSTTNPTLYYSDGTSKYIVPTMDIANQYGLGLNDVRYMHQQEIDAIPLTSSANTKNLSQLVKSNSDVDADGAALYLVSGGKKFQVQSLDQLTAFGFSTNQISYMSLSSLYRLSSGGALQNFLHAPSQFVYKAEAGKKRVIFSPATLKSVNPSGSLSHLTEYTLLTINSGQPLVDGDAVLSGPDGRTWLYQNSKWHYVPSMSSYDCWKFASLPNAHFLSYNQVLVAQTPTPLSCVSQRSDGSRFLMNNVNKIALQPDWGFTSFSTPLDRTIDRLSTVSVNAKSAFKSSADPSLYALENGKKRPISDMKTFYVLGYSDSSITTVHPALLGSLPLGPVKHGSGTLVKDNSGRLYVISDSKKLYIPSMAAVDNFGFSLSKVISPGEQVLSAYTTNNLQMISKVGSQALLVENKTKWSIPASIEAHFGVSSATPAYSVHTLPPLPQKTITRFIKSSQNSTIYYMDSGKKRPVSSWNKLVELGGQDSISVLNNWAVQNIPTGTVI